MKKTLKCPKCGADVAAFRNPLPAVDVIIEMTGEKGIILINRKNEPRLWALPGGFVDYGETLEQAASREAVEETGLAVWDLRQFRAYSDPGRDKRAHTISFVFAARAEGSPKAGDDADGVGIFRRDSLPTEMAFDHRRILGDYFSSLDREM
jgi:8-oxo-dGTP diphosphatase